MKVKRKSNNERLGTNSFVKISSICFLESGDLTPGGFP
jgi:hypothetical protein